ncbi:MAG TPA: glycosyltransferase [Flavipsychrobacter sp.]|nr:glycosyltransferase [Flavipsychrobacter sp.]
MATHRILIITNRVPYPLNDGGSIAMYAMIEGYHKLGWEVLLFSMNTSRHYVGLESLPEFYTQIKFQTFDINTDVKVVPTLMNFFLSRKPNHADRFYEKGFASKLEKIIDDFEPEIIQLESVYLATYLPVIKEATKAKIAIRLHNIEYQIWERLANEATSFRKFYLRDLCSRIKKFELNAWQSADVLIAITETDAALVKNLVSGKEIITVPFGINTKSIKPSQQPEKWIGYHIGAMDWMPNVEAITWFLENVWSDLHKELPDFEFHFAGRNMPGSFEKYERDGVTCSGEVADASAFIADKKMLLVPLRSGGGIRVKILEALTAGKLVISTSIGMQGIDGAVPGKHFLLAEEKADFIRQIKWAVNKKDQAQQIANAGSVLVQREYDQESIMRKLTKRMEDFLQ